MEKEKKLSEINKNKRYKIEIKNVNIKHDKITKEMSGLKDNLTALKQEVNTLNVALKAAKQEIKETAKQHNRERDSIERSLKEREKIN